VNEGLLDCTGLFEMMMNLLNMRMMKVLKQFCGSATILWSLPWDMLNVIGICKAHQTTSLCDLAVCMEI
jgi:hypothetical protein